MSGTTSDRRHWLSVVGAPTIEHLRFRTYAGEEDAAALAEVAQAANAANGDTEFISAASIAIDMANRTHIDPGEDVVLALVGDRLVAWSSIEWSDTADGERHYHSVGDVHPDWRRRGIGSALLRRNEARLRELAATHEHPGPRVLMTWLNDRDEGGLELVTARGYRRVRIYHHMVRPDLEAIEVPLLPEGLEIRPLGREQLRRVWDAMSEAFIDHFGAMDTSEAAFRRWSQDPHLDLDLLTIAFDGDEIAAGVQGQIDPDENEAQRYLRGWTDPIFTRRRWRRRGLASALIGRTLLALRERGMTSAQLGVDSQNANDALTLYRRHGFEVMRSSSEWHKPLAEGADRSESVGPAAGSRG
jgi:GNAT superfamily N-acetyltransferase